MASVELRGLMKGYPGGVSALAPTDLSVAEGELFVVVGPSGSGKSTLLRLIAGLETPSGGAIEIGGRRADGWAPRHRDLALVFQNPAVYPHLSVFDNLAFGLRARGHRRTEIRERVVAVAAQLGLDHLMKRAPRTLSGGERQRVALGRALARRPRLLLLDEPFSSLDAPLRASFRADLREWQGRLGMTTIHVTHDQSEAMALGDRIAVMDRGRIVQTGTPLDVYDRPASRFVAGFLGNPPMSLWPCAVGSVDGSMVVSGTNWATAWDLPAGEPWAIPLRERGAGRVDLGVRPEHLDVVGPGAPPSRAGCWEVPMKVARLEALGHETIAGLALDSFPVTLHARLPAHARFQVGQLVLARFDPARATWFDPETGSRIAGDGPAG